MGRTKMTALEVGQIFGTLEYTKGVIIEPGMVFDSEITMGARQYKSTDDTGFVTLNEATTFGSLEVPEINMFGDYKEAETAFRGSEDTGDKYYYDLMGDVKSHTVVNSTDASLPPYDVFSSVEVGYRLSDNTTDPTKVGILFNVEAPLETFEEGNTLIQWVKYEAIDN
jgi:hypothetical protein